MANLYPRVLTRNGVNTDATSYATASVTPTNGAVLTAYCQTTIAAATPNQPTASGTNGLSGTWTAIGSVVQDQTRITAFRSVAASGVAGVLTFSLGGQTQTAACWEIDQWANVTSNPIVQFKTAVTNGGTNLNFDGDPLAAFESPFNMTYVVAGVSGSFANIRGVDTQGLLHQIAVAGNSSSESAGTALIGPSAVLSPQVNSSVSGDMVAIAMEIAHDDSDIAGGGSTIILTSEDKLYSRKYGTALAAGTKIRRQLKTAAGTAFAVGADWTPGAGDVQISKDGGAFANVATLPAYTNGAWEFELNATEAQAKQINFRIVDAALTSDEFTIETFGHASAMYPDDISEASAGGSGGQEAYP